MISKTIKKYLLKKIKSPMVFNHELAKYTSFKIGCIAELVVFPNCYEEINKIIKIANYLEIPIIILGGGTNVLIKDYYVVGMVIIMTKLNVLYSIIENNNKNVIFKTTCGIKTSIVCGLSIKKGLSGMNFALGIPGTIGGAIMMNSSTFYGSIHDIIYSLTVSNLNGKLEVIKKKNIDISWDVLIKEKIVLDCELILVKVNKEYLIKEAKKVLFERNRKQPKKSFNAGCFFKNPMPSLSAGKLIDKLGFKGKQIGGAMVSKKHANFIINIDNATPCNVLKLMDIIQKTVFKNFEIFLEPEVKIIGNKF